MPYCVTIYGTRCQFKCNSKLLALMSFRLHQLSQGNKTLLELAVELDRPKCIHIIRRFNPAGLPIDVNIVNVHCGNL